MSDTILPTREMNRAAAYRDIRNILANVVSAADGERDVALAEAKQWLLEHCRECGAPITLERRQRGLELCQRCFDEAASEQAMDIGITPSSE